jgi:hypothetical protein
MNHIFNDNMKKQDLFEELGMEEYIWGNAFLYIISGTDLAIEKNRFSVLDEICKIENWNPIGNTWKAFDFSECSQLLMDALSFDIAYSSARITPEEKAKEFHRTLLLHLNETDTFCYSNWSNNHWQTKNGSSWNPLTENTFDLSTVFISGDTILITCFRSED